MTTDIWKLCNGLECVKPLRLDIYRAVESQEQIATAKLVDTLDEQLVLEELLEATKPKSVEYPEKHYLLTTPFRYPPLKHGSRFGTRTQPSLFYASRSIETTLAETAYYRFVFLSGLLIPWGKRLLTEHTTFSVTIDTNKGLALHLPPFDEYEDQLASPKEYSTTQDLGKDMRNADVEAFLYLSARDKNKGINAAAFTPKAIRNRRPNRLTQWLCSTTDNEVVFRKSRMADALYDFKKAEFCLSGKLPLPAL